MAVGTNLKFTGLGKRKLALVNKLLNSRKTGNVFQHLPKNVCHKAGAPVDNAEDDNPGKRGVVCLDVTNSKVYVCKTYTDATTHTWVALN